MTPGERAVIFRRMEALKAAIESRDWFATEFSYDQVLRALAKAHIFTNTEENP